MSGIYIHIPFCKKRCNYCDFYSDTNLQLRELLVKSLMKEIELRKNYLSDKKINTIYFGGGTPSLLQAQDFENIFTAIFKHYSVSPDAEITFEANSDDLTSEYLSNLSALPFNRISIGIQSFNDFFLQLLNRRHSREQAFRSIENAQKAGFNSINIDLIYGLPFQTLKNWEEELNTALNTGIQHISAYGLTYEAGTEFRNMLDNGNIEALSDETMNEMYKMLLDKTKVAGFEAYEISNFALPGFHSRHNSAYWNYKPYIGIGPSAHSYNGNSRQWNCHSITDYIQAISENRISAEEENLSLYNRYNDFVMVSLRTAKGIDLTRLEAQFGTELKNYCFENINSFIETGHVKYSDNTLRLSIDGVLISDSILTKIMRV